MSSTEIARLIDQAEQSFDAPPEAVETGLEIQDAALLQLRKACRLLASADQHLEGGYYTLVIEASFVAIERSIEFRLLERGNLEPRALPGSHTTVYREAAQVGVLSEESADQLADLWRNHRAKTCYQDGLATRERAQRLHDLATEIHRFVVGRSDQGHECLC
jgi:HEPN domain-containing protein